MGKDNGSFYMQTRKSRVTSLPCLFSQGLSHIVGGTSVIGDNALRDEDETVM